MDCIPGPVEEPTVLTPVRAEEPEILIPTMGYNSWSEVPDRPPPGAKMFVEIFAGEAGITSALRKLGVPCLPPVDLVVAAGCKESVDVYLIQEKIMTWIREGAILAVHFGTPCTTYSAARKKDGGPRPLRTAERLKGVPGLTGTDLLNTIIGTGLMKLTAELCQLCQQHKVPWTIENPASSLIWKTPEFKALGGRRILLHACCYGSQYKKPTVYLAWGWGLMSQLASLCPGQPQHPEHPPLTGKVWCPARKKMMYRTKLEQVYGNDLCEKYATLAKQALEESASGKDQRNAQNLPSFSLVTPTKERKRVLGTPHTRPDHRQASTGKKAVEAGYQMKRTVMPPLLTEEVEPGMAIQLALNMKHPFATDAELDDIDNNLINQMVEDPEGLYVEREIIYADWKTRAQMLLPEAAKEIQDMKDQELKQLYSKQKGHLEPKLGDLPGALPALQGSGK